MPDLETLPPEAISALRAGKKIDAIKILREQKNIGLKEAKGMVEQYVASDPVLAHELQRTGNTGLLYWIIIIVLCVMAWYYLSGR